MKSSRYPSLPEENHQQADAHLVKLHSSQDDAKKKLDDHISQLIRTNSWPVNPPPEPEEGETDNRQEIAKYLEQLREQSSHIHEILNDLQQRKTTVNDAAMDIDSDTPPRALKRRRLSNSEQPTLPPVTAESELDALRDKIRRMEGVFSNFENDLVSRDAVLRDEFEERVDGKFEQWIPQLTAAVSVNLPEEHIQEVRDNLETTGKEVEELADEIGSLILRSSTQKTELDEVTRKLHESAEVTAQVCKYCSTPTVYSYIMPLYSYSNNFKAIQMSEQKIALGSTLSKRPLKSTLPTPRRFLLPHP